MAALEEDEDESPFSWMASPFCLTSGKRVENDPTKKTKKKNSQVFKRFKVTSCATRVGLLLTGAICGVAVGERRRLLLLAGRAQLVEVDRQLPDGHQGAFLLGAQVQHLLHVLHLAAAAAAGEQTNWRQPLV